jgi:hypothetical protein
MYVLIWEYVDVRISFKQHIYDFEEYVHMVWRIWYWICMYVVHTIWRIRRVDEDEWRWTDVGGQKGPDKWNQMDRRTDETRRMEMDGRTSVVEANRCQMKLWWMTMNGNVDGTATNGDDNRRRLRQMVMAIDGDYDGQW